jgi:hypothetical protein
MLKFFKEISESLTSLYKTSPLLILIVVLCFISWELWKDADVMEERFFARVQKLEKEIEDCRTSQLEMILSLQEKLEQIEERYTSKSRKK